MKKLLNSVHDISSGGIILSLSEMCISSKIGAKIEIPKNNIGMHEYLFGEDQSRYLIEVSKKNKNEVCKILEKDGIYFDIIGITQNEALELNKSFSIKLTDLSELNSFWFKSFFAIN